MREAARVFNFNDGGYLLLILILSFSACAGHTTASHVQAPGKEVSAKTVLLESGAMLLQQKPPIDALNMYLDGFHFYNVASRSRWKPIISARSSTRR
jgi:hypothetical protein